MCIRTDKRRTFWSTEESMTLMHESLKRLNIDLECDSAATFKPNVERSFSNAQKLYPLLFYKNNILDIKNVFENCDWLFDKYNRRYNKNLTKQSCFIEVDKQVIYDNMCLKKEQKLQMD